MEPRTRFTVGLEEALLPVHILEFDVAFSRWNIDKLALILEYNTIDTFRVPEKLVAIVVTNNVLVVTLSANVHSVRNLVTLISHILVQRSDNVVQEGELLDRLNKGLASGRVEVIVRALENEAQALGHETNLVGFTPAKEIQSDLSNSIMLRHLVHTGLPAILGGLETVITLKILESFGFTRFGVLLLLLVGLLLASALAQAVCESDCIV